MSVVLLVCFWGGLLAPLARAQGFDIDTGGSAGGRRGPAEYRPDPSDEQEFAGDVASRVALKEDLENRWAEATVRSDKARRQIDRLRSASPPSGTDPAEWDTRRQREIARLEQYLRANDQAIGDYRRNLGGVYGQLDRDKQRLYSVKNEGLRQDLGTLLGVGGMAAVPLHTRPTMGNLTSSIKRGFQGRQLASVTKNISGSQTRSAALGDKLSGMSAPTKNTWAVVEEGGRVYVKGADGKLKDMGAATTKSANGTDIRNDSAFRKGDYYNQLYGAKSNITNQIDQLRYNRDRASTIKAKDALDKRITELETKKVRLEKDIAEHDSANPSSGSALKNLATGAAKWAAFSVGITIASNAVQQLAANGWDPSRISWSEAVAPLKTAEFWGGTAGSFGVSMLASALIPGGAFIKTLGAIGGAAVGWQLGTGNIGQTDWMELGATSLGATIGTLIGTALGGPIGAFIGGVAGNYAATWILGKVREWLEAKSEAFDPRDRSSYPTAQDPPGYNRQAPFDPAKLDDYRSSDPSDLKSRMDQSYVQMMQYARDPSQSDKFDRSRREYMQLKGQLEQLQRR